eukprot:m.12771 g.12771  ORF g.12771 m.12771 type:complete len:441 (-) comp9439_c0_seq1:217-1539(-)
MAGNGAWVGAVNNLAIQYNLAAASVCVGILKGYTNTTGHPGEDERGYVEPEWANFSLLGAVFVGAVLGMVVMGSLGDYLGRLPAMMLSLSLALCGALGCALLSWGSAESVFGVLAGCRLLLGVGVGGLYPLSAAKTAEADATKDPDPVKIGWSFFWQTPGAMVPYLVGWAVTAADVHPRMAFRIVFGLGAIPIIAVLIGEYQQMKRLRATPAKPVVKQSYAAKMGHSKQHWKHLIGTGGSWFLFDISYYGTAIFQPKILESIFKTKDLNYAQNLQVAAMGLPGVILAVLLINKLGLKNMNTLGFFMTAIAFAVLAVMFHISPDGLAYEKFAVFCVTMFSLNFGPNICTYVIPATLYPVEVRTTFHGLSAGSGKIGAVVGTFMYAPIADTYGIAAVLWVQVALSALGGIISIIFLPKNCIGPSRFNNKEEEEPLNINNVYE